MFLRADYLDPKKAAIRLVQFMEKKLQYFGPEPLARQICLSDFDKNDLKALKSGVFQSLPERDTAGRLILGSFQKQFHSRPYKRPENLMKTLAFQYLSLIENDINSQKKGTVVLLYFLGNIPLDWDNDFQQNHTPQILEWLPIKVKSIHFCCDSNMLVPLLATPLHRRNRVRLRVHAGSRTECHYSLMTFGFPVQIIPVTSGNKLKTATHLKCAAKQQSRDMAIRQFGDFEGIHLPGSCDILLGRGKNLQEHSGNQIMRKLSKSRWTSTWTQIRSPKQGSRGIC